MAVIRNLYHVVEDDSGVDIDFRADVHAGLSQRPKAIPARWFYDEAGSTLFESITELGEYYLTRCEIDLLSRHADRLASALGEGRALIELGSGSSTKTPLLLRAIAPAAYIPVDISGVFLRDSAASLAADFPHLPVYPMEADFTRRTHLPREIDHLPKLVFFSGSTIGNMDASAAIDLLRTWRDIASDGAFLLIGIDRIKEQSLLLKAYDDAAGVTAAFNLNLIERINRELDGDLPLEHFSHRAIWNDIHARIEMHLVAERDMVFHLGSRTYSMVSGETIHSENSHKYGARDASLLLRGGGWTPVMTCEDSNPAYALILAKAQ